MDMEWGHYIVLVLQLIVALAFNNKHEFNIQGILDCNPRDFSYKTQIYKFTATYPYKCEFPITAPLYNNDKHYCVYVELVDIDQSCPIEMRIYQGLNAYLKVPKVTLTCDSKIQESFCVWGPNAGVFIKFRAHQTPLFSKILIRIEPSTRPRTTTSFTPNFDTEGSYMKNMSMSNILIILTIAAAVIFVFIPVCYCCCCRKSNQGTVIRGHPMNYNPTPTQPVFSDAASSQQQSIIPPREPYLIPYDQGPPDYSTSTSLPLITPSAPPLEPLNETIYVDNDPPPSYESVINSSDTTDK